jgi:hypothetical protein
MSPLITTLAERRPRLSGASAALSPAAVRRAAPAGADASDAQPPLPGPRCRPTAPACDLQAGCCCCRTLAAACVPWACTGPSRIARSLHRADEATKHASWVQAAGSQRRDERAGGSGVRALEPLSTFRTCAQPLSTSGGSCTAAGAAGAGAAAGAAACGCACAASAPACGWSARAQPQPVEGAVARRDGRCPCRWAPDARLRAEHGHPR